MTIRQNSLVIALLALFVGGSVVLAEPLFKKNLNSDQFVAQTPEGRMGKRGKFGQGRVLEELNLSEQQQQQLEAIKQKYQGQFQPLRENMRTLRQELQTMMTGTASNNQIRAKHQQLAASRQQMENLRFESMLEMREVLTPEQRSKFGQLMEQYRGKGRQQ